MKKAMVLSCSWARVTLSATTLFAASFALQHVSPGALHPIPSAYAEEGCSGCGGSGGHGGGHESGGESGHAGGSKGSKGKGGATGGHQPADMGHKGSSSHGGGSKSLESNVFHAPGGEEEDHEEGKGGVKGKGKGGSAGHETTSPSEGTEHSH